QIDFKKELETASKSMIMIHDPKLLIKLIIRMIVCKLQVKHAAMVLYESDRDAYVLSISRGESGVKLPAGYTRFNLKSRLIKLFSRKEYKRLTYNRSAIVSEDINRLIWHETVIKNGNGNGHEIKELLHKVNEQMEMLNSVACVPAYYRHTLMVVLLLGEKYDEAKFNQEELDFFAALASDAAMAIRNAQLFTHLKAQSERNRKLFLQTINVLGSTIEAKDSYTHGHTERVTQYSLAIARQMVANGSEHFSKSFFENLYIAALLHDIGKIAIPEDILNKPGRLTKEEYVIIQKHPIKGAEIITPLSLSQECYNGILYHHEHFDGKGYPEGLEGENIPVSASIIAVADAYDAMTSERPYRKSLDKSFAIEEIERNISTQFSPLPAQAMLELYERGEV
ncbi:MAG: HD-GYP domain-containing protein, partial [Candidatus Omnitrophica bacterium]|nr:HD-GYP domain-containing protein [Candidatus Omnitrophota bacterium]